MIFKTFVPKMARAKVDASEAAREHASTWSLGPRVLEILLDSSKAKGFQLRGNITFPSGNRTGPSFLLVKRGVPFGKTRVQLWRLEP